MPRTTQTGDEFEDGLESGKRCQLQLSSVQGRCGCMNSRMDALVAYLPAEMCGCEKGTSAVGGGDGVSDQNV